MVSGKKFDDDEMKADLLATLPAAIQSELLWRATDPGTFAAFRDMVQAQAAKILLNQRRLPVHNVDEEITADFGGKINSIEDLLAAINRWNRRPKTPPPRQDSSTNRARADGGRPARRGPNCG